MHPLAYGLRCDVESLHSSMPKDEISRVWNPNTAKRNWWTASGCRAEIEAKDNHTRKGRVELLLWIIPQCLGVLSIKVNRWWSLMIKIGLEWVLRPIFPHRTRQWEGLVELLLWIMPQYLCFPKKNRQYPGKIGHSDDDDRACCYPNQVKPWNGFFSPHYSTDEITNT